MKTTLILFASLLGMKLVAQPVLQESNFANIGYTATIYVTSSTGSGPAGANQTWNFSTWTGSNAGGLAVMSPSSTPCAALFPSANWAQMTPGNNYNYFIRSSTKLETMGENIPSSCSGGINYSNFRQSIKFPFNYLDTYTDTYQNNTGSGSVTYLADAYGTLITPYGTFNNVLRLAITENSSTNYQWCTTGPNSMVVMMITSNNTLYFIPGGTSGVSESQLNSNVNIYPNPSNGKLTIEQLNYANNAEINIYNSLGTKIMNTSINEKSEIDLSQNPKGIYFVELIRDGNRSFKKLILE